MYILAEFPQCFFTLVINTANDTDNPACICMFELDTPRHCLDSRFEHGNQSYLSIHSLICDYSQFCGQWNYIYVL